MRDYELTEDNVWLAIKAALTDFITYGAPPDSLVLVLKDHYRLKQHLIAYVAPVVEFIAAEYSDNVMLATISALRNEYAVGEPNPRAPLHGRMAPGTVASVEHEDTPAVRSTKARKKSVDGLSSSDGTTRTSRCTCGGPTDDRSPTDIYSTPANLEYYSVAHCLLLALLS